MASEQQIEKLVLAIEANTAKAQKDLKKFVDKHNSNTKKVVRSNKKTQTSFQRTAQSIAVLQGPLGGVASRISSFNSLMTGSGAILGSFALASGAASFGVYRMIQAFSEAEVRLKTTEGLLTATSTASGKTAQQIEALSRQVGLSTLASTQDVREASNALLTFRTISEDVFDRALIASQDMVAAGFGNIKSNAIQLGKALESPREGLTALKRIGVDFSQSQKDLINKLNDSGQKFEAQKLILEGVERQMKGSGVAAAQSLAGAYDTLTEATGRTFERWGGMIARGTNLQKVMQDMGDSIERVNKLADDPRARLRNIDDRIAGLSKKKFRGGPRTREHARNQLHSERIETLRQVIALRQDEEAAAVKSAAARKQMADAQIAGVKGELEERIRLANLSKDQLLLEENLKKAGVEANSARGQEIATLVEQLNMLENRQAVMKENNQGIKSILGGEPGDILNQLNDHFLTREEAEIASHERRIAAINSFLETEKNLTANQRNQLIQIEKSHARVIESLEKKQTYSQLREGASRMTSMLAQAKDSSRAMFNLHKVAAISEAILNARESVLSSYKFGASIGGPILGAAFAGVATAATAANIAQIASSSFGGGGGVSSISSSVSLPSTSFTSSNENISTINSTAKSSEVRVVISGEGLIPTSQLRGIIEDISEQLESDNIRLVNA